MTGLPLGSAKQHTPAVMVNLLGDIWPQQSEPDWLKALNNAHLKMHLYGKQSARAGRKMGHYTVVNENQTKALAQAMHVRTTLGIDQK